MLCRLVSLCPFSVFPTLVGGKRTVLPEIIFLLHFTLLICQSSRLLRFWFLETWQSSLTHADFLTLVGFLTLVDFLDVVFHAGSLPDSQGCYIYLEEP